MENLEPYLDKFNESGKRILEIALDETRCRDQYFISPEHIFYALIEAETDLFDSAMRNLSIDSHSVRAAVEKRLENSRQHTGQGFRIAPETTDIFKCSMDRARSQHRRTIAAEDILYTLTTNKLDLLNDILQNPDKPPSFWNNTTRLPNRLSQNPNIPGGESDSDKISAKGSQKYFLPQLENKPSGFFIQFSLQELVKNNDSPSAGLSSKNGMGGIGFGTSGVGTVLSGGDSEQTTNTKHESLTFAIKSSDFDKFDEAQFISSLRKDVENDINRFRLKITQTDNPNSSIFRFEYSKGKIKGRLEISGAMKDGYYELKAMVSEASNRKIR